MEPIVSSPTYNKLRKIRYLRVAINTIQNFYKPISPTNYIQLTTSWIAGISIATFRQTVGGKQDGRI